MYLEHYLDSKYFVLTTVAVVQELKYLSNVEKDGFLFIATLRNVASRQLSPFLFIFFPIFDS